MTFADRLIVLLIFRQMGVYITSKLHFFEQLFTDGLGVLV
jgi:hypothetical protein